MPTKPTLIELDMDRLQEVLRRVETNELTEDDLATVREVIESYVGLFYLVGEKTTTIARLRKMLFGVKTEKTASILGGITDSESSPVAAGSRQGSNL
ncbi:MAG TPA: hypothetical protein DD670_12700 [Planctomycetaceae bacterium]|nr:hypothetical protein [Planctomycetaceae bacterium]